MKHRFFSLIFAASTLLGIEHVARAETGPGDTGSETIDAADADASVDSTVVDSSTPKTDSGVADSASSPDVVSDAPTTADATSDDTSIEDTNEPVPGTVDTGPVPDSGIIAEGSGCRCAIRPTRAIDDVVVGVSGIALVGLVLGRRRSSRRRSR